jgi:cytochrome c1
MKRILLASLFVAVPALAGPYDQPYVIITTDRAKSADPNLRPVIVNRVDDETVMSNNRAVVAPGKHQVTLDLPPRKGFKVATQHTFELDTKACTRYHVAAKLDSPTTQEWAPVVRSEEAIGECRRKFKVTG